jgi:hypothetical protein
LEWAMQCFAVETLLRLAARACKEIELNDIMRKTIFYLIIIFILWNIKIEIVFLIIIILVNIMILLFIWKQSS